MISGSLEGPRRIDPADRAQLAESPVKLARLGALFARQRWRLVVLLGLIVAVATIGMGQPFLLRAVIDDALPNRDQRLLVAAVAGMIGIATLTAFGGVLQTWWASSIGQRVMHELRVDVFANVRRQSMVSSSTPEAARSSRGWSTTSRAAADPDQHGTAIVTSPPLWQRPSQWFCSTGG